MTELSHLSDRMPAVAHARDSWSAEDLRHLASCSDCRAEWKLVLTGSRLGGELERELDLDALTAAVTTRLREAPKARGLRLPALRWAVLAAAAAAIVVAVLLRQVTPGARNPTAAAQQALLPELEDLSADELETLFEVLPAADALLEPGIPGFDELTEDDLKSVLRTLEG
jgi:hypothetical protein